MESKSCKICGTPITGPYRQYCTKCVYKKSRIVSTKVCTRCNQEFHPHSVQQTLCHVCNRLCIRFDNPRGGKWSLLCKECEYKARGSANATHASKLESRNCRYCGKSFQPNVYNQYVCNDVHYCKCPICGKQLEGIKDRCCSVDCQTVAQKLKNNKNWGADYPLQTERGMDLFKARNIELYGTPFPVTIFGGGPIAKADIVMCDLLTQQGISAQVRFKLDTYCFDIHILDTNILIEMNGTYWHSIICQQSPKSKYYHQDRSKIASNAGYICIHVYDWDNVNNIILLLNSGKKLTGSQFNEPKLHWYNYKEHIIDDGTQKWDDMIPRGYLPVYDAGQEVIAI